MATVDTSLPTEFCWTKFGAEAGDAPAAIRHRKEEERKAGGGLFYWGIGNSVAPSLRALVQRDRHPAVVFTPMLSRPSPADVSPARVVSWRQGFGLDGRAHRLENGAVTSKGGVRGLPARHFALVCFSEQPVDEDCDPLTFTSGSVENLQTGTAVGSSQVTSVVRRRAEYASRGRLYSVAFRARLVEPYFLTLVHSDGPAAASHQDQVPTHQRPLLRA